MKKKSLARVWIYSGLALLAVILSLPRGVEAGQNDRPEGGAQTQVDYDPNQDVWWEGSLSTRGDVDWYWFEIPAEVILKVSFERPVDKKFSCKVYAANNTSVAVSSDIGTRNAEELRVKPGKYYLKIWGNNGDYTEREDETYKYSLFAQIEKPAGKESGEEAQELTEEETERLLNALLSEEEGLRELANPYRSGELPGVRRDW